MSKEFLSFVGACTFLAAVLFVVAGMFEYSLYTITGKDVNFGLDILGGLVLNALNFPIFVFSLIYRACGYPVPVFG